MTPEVTIFFFEIFHENAQRSGAFGELVINVFGQLKNSSNEMILKSIRQSIPIDGIFGQCYYLFIKILTGSAPAGLRHKLLIDGRVIAAYSSPEIEYVRRDEAKPRRSKLFD
jgi:hypothetical protein